MQSHIGSDNQVKGARQSLLFPACMTQPNATASQGQLDIARALSTWHKGQRFKEEMD